MPPPRKRDLAKAAIRLHCSVEGPSLEEAAEQVGLELESLRRFQRRGHAWRELCRDVFTEQLTLALPVAVCRLVTAARTDKSSSGITAAKTLIDIVLKDDDDPNPDGDITDEIDFEKLTKEEREVACKLFARAQRAGAPG